MFLVYDTEMNPISFPDGVTPLDIFISSTDKERRTSKLEGKHGLLDYGFTYNSRDIDLEILIKANDTMDYRLLRNEVYAMFQRHDKLYVSELYDNGKRYLISVDERFIPNRIPNNQRFAEASIKCTKLGSPFSESIKTTSDIDKSGLNYGDGWYYGMGLLYDEESHKYTHTSSSFRIYNAGNRSIHPFEQDLIIEISDVVGSTDFLEVKNITNNTHFKVTEKVTSGQKIKIDGPNVTNNGSQFLRSTDKNFIELAPGWNEFQVTGATKARVSFDFPFYYL